MPRWRRRRPPRRPPTTSRTRPCPCHPERWAALRRVRRARRSPGSRSRRGLEAGRAERTDSAARAPGSVAPAPDRRGSAAGTDCSDPPRWTWRQRSGPAGRLTLGRQLVTRWSQSSPSGRGSKPEAGRGPRTESRTPEPGPGQTTGTRDRVDRRNRNRNRNRKPAPEQARTGTGTPEQDPSGPDPEQDPSDRIGPDRTGPTPASKDERPQKTYGPKANDPKANGPRANGPPQADGPQANDHPDARPQPQAPKTNAPQDERLKTKGPAFAPGKGRRRGLRIELCGCSAGNPPGEPGAPHPRGERRPCAARWCNVRERREGPLGP